MDLQVKSAVGGKLHKCTRMATNRKKWRETVARITKAKNVTA